MNGFRIQGESQCEIIPTKASGELGIILTIIICLIAIISLLLFNRVNGKKIRNKSLFLIIDGMNPAEIGGDIKVSKRLNDQIRNLDVLDTRIEILEDELY